MHSSDLIGTLEYNKDKPEELRFVFNEHNYRLFSHPYEPCLYIYDGDNCVCTLHTAFNTEELVAAFSAGKSVKAIDWKDYDETAFCKILTATLDSKRAQLDFTYAAKLAGAPER